MTAAARTTSGRRRRASSTGARGSLTGWRMTLCRRSRTSGTRRTRGRLKDSLAYAQQSGLRFDLYVRGGANPTTLSKPLAAAIRNGDIGLRYIP